MDRLIEKIIFYSKKNFIDEDGNCLRLELNEGITIEKISKFEQDNGFCFPHVLKELLLLSNGINLFGQQIFSLEEMEYFAMSEVVSFHSWGNGDFDCLSVGNRYPKEAVVFMFHSEEKIELINRDLTQWIEEVINEISKIGTLLHPLEYEGRESEGIYKELYKRLQDGE